MQLLTYLYLLILSRHQALQLIQGATFTMLPIYMGHLRKVLQIIRQDKTWPSDHKEGGMLMYKRYLCDLTVLTVHECDGLEAAK